MTKKQTKKAGKARKTPKPAAPVRAEKAPRTRERDPRLPAPGTTLIRPYKGKEIRVTVLDEGFRWDGKEYRSLSALAAQVTGAASINGYLFFKLTGGAAPAATKPLKRHAKPAAAAPSAASESAPAPESATA